MTHDLLGTLMLSTLASSAAMLLVLALRKPMRRQFGAHATYALWMLAPLSAVIALLPAPMAAYSIWMMPTGMIGTVAATAIAIPPAPGIDLMLYMAGIWFAGSCIVCAVFVRQQQRFVRGLGHLKRFSPDIAFAQTNAGCPALVGAWRPRV